MSDVIAAVSGARPLPVRRGAARTPMPWLGALLVAYLAVPIVAFVVRLLSTTDRGFAVAGLFPALATSALAATISLGVVTVLGVPLAYLLSRSKSRLAGTVGLLVQLPLALPPVMSGILLIYLVGPDTAIGRFFSGALTESLVGIVLAQTFVSAPFLVVAARAAFGAVDPALEDVASTLGHGAVGRFLRVAVPVAAPGIRAGMVLAWLRAFGEYGATVVLAYHPTSLPVYTFTQFSATGLPATMAPTALALGVAACCVGISLVVIRRSPWRLGRRRAPRRPGRTGPLTGPLPGPLPQTGAVRARVAPGNVRPAPEGVARGPSISFRVDVRRGEFRLHLAHRAESSRLAVLGPSGSGKSTLLRCLAGIHGPGSAEVRVGERRLDVVAPANRRIGYVAQHFGLFPHLAAWQQVRFGRDADEGTAARWFERLGLAGLEARLPSELSGGQRQRVALAQALARHPDVLLLDEPFSALDTPVRHELRLELRRLQHESGISTVIVTHDPEEAALLADEVLVVEDGRVLQRGRIREVFERPGSREVARLLGVPNAYGGVVRAPGLVAIGDVDVRADTGSRAPGARVLWAARPDAIGVRPADADLSQHAGGARPGEAAYPPGSVPPGSVLPGVVEDVADLGLVVEVTVRCGDLLVVRARTTDGDLALLLPGAACTVELPHALAWSPSADEPPALPGAALSEAPAAPR